MKKVTFDVIILGGGISGLVAAYSQQKKGKKVLLLEASNRLGGVIKTVFKDGYRLENGPSSILSNEEINRLIKELKLKNSIRKNETIASTRYLLFKNKPLKIKPSWAFLTSGFLNFRMIWALLTERFRKKKILEEESIAKFIKRRLNRDILNRMINPLVTGIYAGDPKKLSLRSTFKKLFAMEQEYGSLVKAMFSRKKNIHKREAISFKNGLATLTNTLAKKIKNTTLNASIKNVSLLKNGFKIIYSHKGKMETIISSEVISTLPPTITGKVFNMIEQPLKNKLKTIEFAPMLLVYLGYPKSSVNHTLDGFGYLISQQEKQPYLGSIWTSAVFPEVAPSGMVLFTLFVGGVNNKEVINQPKKCIDKAKFAFEKHMKITTNPTFQSHFLQEKAIPQFNLGYYKLMKKLDIIENQHKALKISGNWRSGVAIGDCVAKNMHY